MDKNTKFFTKINYNFYFLLLLLFTCKINLGKCSTFLKDNFRSSQYDKQLDTAFITTDNDEHNIYPFSPGQEKYFTNGVCSEKNCLEPYGRCENSNLCACNIGYAQLPNKLAANNQLSCSTALKSQAIFFALELLTWIGIGHIYAGRLIYGFVKMSVFIFILILDCVMKRYLFSQLIIIKNKNSLVILSYVLYAFYLMWQTIDIMFIGSNLFRDGNGFKIMTWDK